MKQPPPTPNASTPIWDLVIADMRERDQVGRKTYGTPLQAGNGRDALGDAYAESLDQAVYLKQAIVERDIAVRIVGLLHDLRQREGNVIELPHENPDFGGPGVVVGLSRDFGETWERFTGETLLEVLEKMAEAGDTRPRL